MIANWVFVIHVLVLGAMIGACGVELCIWTIERRRWRRKHGRVAPIVVPRALVIRRRR